MDERWNCTSLASPSPISTGVFLSHIHMKFIAGCLLQQGRHIIILSAYEHSELFFLFSVRGAFILPQTDHVKQILTQVLVCLQALTSSFGYNYLPRSGILSTFVTETPTLPDEINLSYFLTWIFFLPVADLILKAQWRIAAQGLPFTCELGLLFSPQWPTSRLINVSGPCTHR